MTRFEALTLARMLHVLGVVLWIEPLFLHAWFRERAAAAPERTFASVLRLHRALLAASLLTVLGAVAGSHGWLPGGA